MIINAFAKEQKKRTLKVSLIVIIGLTVVLGFVYLFLHRDAVMTSISLFILAPVSAFSLFLTFRGRETAASFIIVTLAFAVIAFNIYDGEGLADPAVMAFPAVIVFGGLLLGRKAVIFIIGAVLADLAVQIFLASAGLVTYRVSPSVTETVTLVLIVCATACVAYAIIGNFEALVGRIHGQSIDLEKELAARRDAESALRDSEERYRTIFHNVNDAVIVYDDVSGAIFDVNERLPEMFGYSREEALSLAVEDLRLGSGACCVKRTGKGEEPSPREGISEFECRARHRDGREFWAEVRTRPIRLQGTECRLILVRDIDERKKAEERLLFAQKLEMLGMLSSGIVHDFNNILFSLQGSLKKARSERETGEGFQGSGASAFLDVVEGAIGRLKTATRDLLTLARRDDPLPQLSDLNRVSESVAAVCARSFEPTVKVSCFTPGEPALARVDSDRIEQALLNLCLNARLAVTSMRNDGSRQGGEISISVDRFLPDGDFRDRHAECRTVPYWRIEVKDDGVGMSPEILDRAFEPFFTTREKGEGNGLGLAMVKKILQGHSGFVLAESTKGKGSTFTLFVPAADGTADDRG
ncbi:MAG: PAS domain S-box protein [Spirochaetales bacterium]|nr:PAS domain S-box protein [Spirochaetales bacterium]